MACAAFSAAGYLGVFPVTGCLSFSLPGGVGWGFSPSLLFLGFSCSACLLGLLKFCTLCQGAPVAVVSAWFAGEVTLLPFHYLRVGVLLACSVSSVCACESGLGCPSWFVTALGSWTAYSGRWMVQVPAVFLNLTLGSSLSLPGWLLA